MTISALRQPTSGQHPIDSSRLSLLSVQQKPSSLAPKSLTELQDKHYVGVKQLGMQVLVGQDSRGSWWVVTPQARGGGGVNFYPVGDATDGIDSHVRNKIAGSGFSTVWNENGQPIPGRVEKFSVGGFYGPTHDDLISGDYPIVNGRPTVSPEIHANTTSLALVQAASKLSNQQLIDVFRAELSTASRELAPEMFNRWLKNSTQPKIFGPNSALSKAVAADPQAKRLVETFTARLKNSALDQLKSGTTVDFAKLKINVNPQDRLNWSAKSEPLNPLIGPLGGTKGVQMELINPKFNAQSGKMTGVMRIKVQDNFGASKDDAYTPGLAAFWVLQHQRGFKAFANETIFEKPFEIQLRKPK
jgi:hypothetical protein